MTKLCIDCKKTLPLIEFPSRACEKKRAGQYRSYCKSCQVIRQRKSYRNYKARNPFKCRCTKLRSTAKFKGLKFNLTPEYLESIWTGKCPILGIDLKFSTNRIDESAAELDRLVPANGYTVGNVIWISRKMNRLKNSASSTDLERLLQWMKNIGL